MARDNKTLGKFTLANIPPAPRGVPQIEVTFDIDANGIVNVTAKDRGTGQEQKITISGTTALSDDEVDRMVKEAESHASEDQARKEEVEARNDLDTLVYGTEKTIKDLGDKVPADTKSTVEAARRGGQEGARGLATSTRSRPQTEKLREASYKLAEVVYADESAAAERRAAARAGRASPPATRPRGRGRGRRRRSRRRRQVGERHDTEYQSNGAGAARRPAPPRAGGRPPRRRGGVGASRFGRAPPTTRRSSDDMPAAGRARRGGPAGRLRADPGRAAGRGARGGRRVPRPRDAGPGRVRELPQAHAARAGRPASRAPPSAWSSEMLPALDNLERALAHVREGGDAAQLLTGRRDDARPDPRRPRQGGRRGHRPRRRAVRPVAAPGGRPAGGPVACPTTRSSRST